MGNTSARTPARSRQRALLGVSATVALAVVAQVPQVASTSAQTPTPSATVASATATPTASTTVASTTATPTASTTVASTTATPTASSTVLSTTASGGIVGTAVTPGAPAGPGVVFSSFVGGTEWDEGGDVEVDSAGNSYLAGFTLSNDFTVAAAAQGRFAGLADGFVTKVAADGQHVWSTYFGGVDIDIPNSLAMDDRGNVYVTGRTASPDFPTTRGAFQPRLRGRLCQRQVPCHDAFVTKLDPNGRIVYSTLLGGSANEEGVSIAVDRRGQAWVTGNTDSTDLPVAHAVQRAFQSPPCPGHLPCEYDVFVSALSNDGRRLLFSSYLGGDASDTAGGIAVDDAGSAYVTGTTRSADFPVAGRALQGRISGVACGPPPGAPCLDAFATKITNRRLAYSTYFGGAQDERSSGIAVDRAGQAVITGSTSSPGLPLRNAVQLSLANRSCTTEVPEERCHDAFVTQLTASGGGLVYSTYLGGQAEDQGLAVTMDTGGNAHVAGRTDSRDFPVLRASQPTFGGYIDGFAATLSARTGSLSWSTFVGGKKADRVTGVDTHRSGSVHLTGRTLSSDFPTNRPFQPRIAKDDDYDAFVRVLR